METEPSIHPALKQATEEIPERWYENPKALIAVPLGTLALAYVEKFFGPDINHNIQAISGFVITTVFVVGDRVTTYNLMNNLSQAEAQGIPRPYYEQSAIVGRHDTAEQFMRNKKSWAADVVVSATSAISWLFAVPFSTLKAMAGLNNHRKSRRLARAMQINEQIN